MIVKSRVCKIFGIFVAVFEVDGWMKEYGAAKRPIKRLREKFRVARAERKRPSNRREKHCNSINSCFVGLWFARCGRTVASR